MIILLLSTTWGGHEATSQEFKVENVYLYKYTDPSTKKPWGNAPPHYVVLYVNHIVKHNADMFSCQVLYLDLFYLFGDTIIFY